MDRDNIMSLTKKLSNISKSILRKKGMTTDSPIKEKHIETINASMKKHKVSKRKNLSRKLKKMKNMLKATSKVSPCLLTALAEQEKCIINEGRIPHSKKIFDTVCSQNGIQKVIQNWNPHPENNYFLSESDPDYDEKKKKKDEYFTWYSTISGCGQTVHNNLLEASTLKDERMRKKYEHFYTNKENKENKENNLNLNDKYEAETEIILGGKKNKTKKKRKSRRRKSHKRRKSRTRRRRKSHTRRRRKSRTRRRRK